MAICVAAGGALAVIAAQGFTLAWTHSVEKIRWEEDWQAERGVLMLTEARVKGSGAGMEVPARARLVDGAWRFRPDDLPPQTRLVLAGSSFAADYELCWAGRCRALSAMLAEPGTPVVVSACLNP